MSIILIIDSNQDTVFISGLPDDVSEDQLVSHFGSIGVIKVCNSKLKNL
jgi:RNA recognition motif-containing protein